MSVNPSSSFSSINFGKLFDSEPQFLDISNKTAVETLSLLEQGTSSPNLNPNDVAAARFGIAHQTQRTRLTPSNNQDKELQYQPKKLTGKDGKVYNGDSTTVADDERFGILVDNIGKEDSRETILLKAYEATAKAAGYSEATAARIAGALVDEQQQLEASTGEQRATIYNPETRQPRDETRLNNIRRDGQLNFRVTGATLKHMEEVNQRQLSQQQVTAELATGKMPSDELLQKAGIDRAKLDVVLKDIGWQPVPTFEEAVNKLAAEKKDAALARRKEALSHTYIDTIYNRSPESQMNDAQLTDYTRKQAESEIRRAIGKGELQVRSDDRPATISAYTPTLADRARPLIEKYMPGIAALNTPEGIKTTNIEAFAASYINARLFGATDFYVDKSRFHNERQANEAAAFSMAGSVVGELQNLKVASNVVGAAMNTTRIAKAMTALKESGTTGKILAQALPAATTFGGLETAKETVKAATGQSNGVIDATKNVVRATATGAVFGVFEPLPLGARVPAVAAGSYGVDKVFGVSNQEAATNAATNALFAAIGGRGGESHKTFADLNGKNVRIETATGKTAVVKVTLTPEGKVKLEPLSSKDKAAADYKVTITTVDAKTAARAAEARLTEIRNNLSPAAKTEFDQMRDASKTTAEFVAKLKGDPAKMFENIAKQKIEAPRQQAEAAARLTAARAQVDQPNFVNQGLTQIALKRNDIDLMREQISIELTKHKLETQYSSLPNSELQTGKKIYKDSGFTTKADWIADWQAKHPGETLKNTNFLLEADGKVWQLETDIDIAVLQRQANGKLKFEHVEQIKAGKSKSSSAEAAQEQLNVTIANLQKIAAGDPAVRIYEKQNGQDIDITGNYEVGDVKDIKAVKRGANDKPGFDETIGLTSTQVTQLANELLVTHRATGGKP